MAVIGLVAFLFDVFRIGVFLMWPCWLTVLRLVMAAWCCVFVAAGCVLSGFAVEGLAAVSLAVVRFTQCPVHRSDAAET